MSAVHPTFEDKGRDEALEADSRWRPLDILLPGGLSRAVLVPDGTYLLEVQLSGKATRPHPLGIRVQRYPGQNSTAWYRVVIDEPGFWYDTHGGLKIVVGEPNAAGTVARRVGLEYRLAGGSVAVRDRILKFVRQL
jgi:hypothetical protein